MNKHILPIILIAAGTLGAASAYDPTPSASPSATVGGGGTRCEQNSSSVEVHTFYGSKEIVGEKVADLPANLSERRVFLQVTQGGRKNGALTATEVKLFVAKEGGGFTVTKWKKDQAPSLLDELDRAIVKNKGEKCVGDAMEKVLKDKFGSGEMVTPLVAPMSPKDAFGPSVRDASGDFLKTAIIFGC